MPHYTFPRLISAFNRGEPIPESIYLCGHIFSKTSDEGVESFWFRSQDFLSQVEGSDFTSHVNSKFNSERFESGMAASLLVKSKDVLEPSRVSPSRCVLKAERMLLFDEGPRSLPLSLPELDRIVRGNMNWQEFWDFVELNLKKIGLLRVQTPSLVPCPGTEPHLEPFATQFRFGSKVKNLFLPTSSELHLKRLFAKGFTDFYEMRSVFRNGEVTERHQPEFFMLEWYRAFSGLEQIENDLMFLLQELSEKWCGAKVPKFIRYTMSELFKEKIGFDLRVDSPREELEAWCRQKGVHCTKDDSWDELFTRLYIEFIEPGLIGDTPILVTDFPPSQAALARRNNSGWSARFELYWRGFEIANAYDELTDPHEQRARMLEDIRLRDKLGRTPVPLDEEFLKDLEHAPRSAGVALGLERLYLALTNERSLASLRLFPFRDQT